MAKKKPRKRAAPKVKPPADQAGASPLNGVVPPVEHRFQPGVSGNPAGRTKAGATMIEWLNVFAEKELDAAALKEIARDSKAPFTKRAAAERAMRLIEAGDMTDFVPWLDGTKTLNELKQAGINTEVVKKAKISDKGAREIELYDRAGEDFDRICDRTDGKPRQSIEVKQTATDILPDDQIVALLLKMKSPPASWPPGVRARYEAGMVPGYPAKKGKS